MRCAGRSLPFLQAGNEHSNGSLQTRPVSLQTERYLVSCSSFQGRRLRRSKRSGHMHLRWVSAVRMHAVPLCGGAAEQVTDGPLLYVATDCRLFALQVKDVRYNIEFTPNYTEVAYSYYEFQTFLPEQSCKGCTLSDNFVGINRRALACFDAAAIYAAPHWDAWHLIDSRHAHRRRRRTDYAPAVSHACSDCCHRAYQNVLTSLGGSEYSMVLQLAPALVGGVITNIADAFTAVG